MRKLDYNIAFADFLRVTKRPLKKIEKQIKKGNPQKIPPNPIATESLKIKRKLKELRSQPKTNEKIAEEKRLNNLKVLNYFQEIGYSAQDIEKCLTVKLLFPTTTEAKRLRRQKQLVYVLIGLVAVAIVIAMFLIFHKKGKTEITTPPASTVI